MSDQPKSTCACCSPQPPPHHRPTLEERAEAALREISTYPVAFNVSPERRALFSAALAKLAGAVADFAALAAEAGEDEFFAEARIGDALLATEAVEAVDSLVELQQKIGTISYTDMVEDWGDYGDSFASGDCMGEEGQRLLITMAEKLRARYGW